MKSSEMYLFLSSANQRLLKQLNNCNRNITFILTKNDLIHKINILNIKKQKNTIIIFHILIISIIE